MVKVFALIPKRPDISDDEFHSHWRDPHGVLAQRIRTLRRYVQSHRLGGRDAALGDVPYEGIAEAWFDDLDSASGLLTNPDYTEHALLDEPNFMDVPQLAFLMTQENVVEAGAALDKDVPTVKLLHLVRRPDGAALEEWRESWAVSGAGLAAALGAQRHVTHLAMLDTYGDDGVLYDGVRELTWFDDGSFDAARRDAAAWSSLADPALVGEGSGAVVAEEYRVIWP